MESGAEPPIIQQSVDQVVHQEPVPVHKLSFPPFVLILAAFSLIAFTVGLVRLPRTINLGIAFSQGKKALANNQPQIAVAKLKPIIQAYPEAKDVRLVLFRASVMAGDIETFADQIKFFEGKEVSKQDNDELNEIEKMAVDKFKELEK